VLAATYLVVSSMALTQGWLQPGYPGAAPFPGNLVYPGSPAFPFQGGPAVAPGFQAYAAIQPQQMGFVGTGFDGSGRGAAVRNI
jgi:hypothetical protein